MTFRDSVEIMLAKSGGGLEMSPTAPPNTDTEYEFDLESGSPQPHRAGGIDTSMLAHTTSESIPMAAPAVHSHFVSFADLGPSEGTASATSAVHAVSADDELTPQQDLSSETQIVEFVPCKDSADGAAIHVVPAEHVQQIDAKRTELLTDGDIDCAWLGAFTADETRALGKSMSPRSIVIEAKISEGGPRVQGGRMPSAYNSTHLTPPQQTDRFFPF